MAKTFIAGGALLAAAALAILLDGLLGLGLGSVLLGVAIGGALGLGAAGSAVGRLGSFLVGFGAALVAYLLRILVLNDSPVGLWLFAAFVIVVVTIASGATGNRLPLWAGLLGAVAVVGSYEAAFLASPQNIQAELFSSASTTLVPISLAFLAALLATDTGEPAAAADEWEPDQAEFTRGAM